VRGRLGPDSHQSASWQSILLALDSNYFHVLFLQFFQLPIQMLVVAGDSGSVYRPGSVRVL